MLNRLKNVFLLFIFFMAFAIYAETPKQNQSSHLASSSKEDVGLIKVDPALISYKKVSAVKGNLTSVGSDTLNNLMAFWTEKFKNVYPNVNIQVEGKGSSTAPTALIEGTSQLGPMSRKMKSSEIDKFEKKFGYPPTLIEVAIDALAVFTHKSNPTQHLTLKQVDSVFSSTYRRGGASIKTWGEVGVKEIAWKNRPISLYGTKFRFRHLWLL